MAYQVLIATHPSLGRSYLIVTSWRVHSGLPAAEAFLLAADTPSSYRSEAFRLASTNFDLRPEDIARIDLGFAAREWGLEQLEADLRRWHEGQVSGTPQPAPVVLVDADSSELLRLWLRGGWAEALKKVKEETQDRELRAAIDEVDWLPTIVRRTAS